jgi:hypothetical protein
MHHSDSRMAPSPEAATDEPASSTHPLAIMPPAYSALTAEQAYRAGLSEGIERGGHALPAPASPPAAPPGEPADLIDFEPVPLRRRSGGLTPEKQRQFVEALADTGVAREAAARVGLSEQAINRVRRRADARSFDRACEAAHRLGARQLRSVAFERAIEGTLRGHYYRGERISEERVFDNRLLVYLLGKTEHLIEEREESRAVVENWEACMDALEQGLDLPSTPRGEAGAEAAAELDEDEEDGPSEEQVWLEDGTWWTLFPAPAGFDGEEHGELGDEDYQRTLSAEERDSMAARKGAKDEAELARCCALRDRAFGLPPRGCPALHGAQAETSETSARARPAGRRTRSRLKRRRNGL